MDNIKKFLVLALVFVLQISIVSATATVTAIASPSSQGIVAENSSSTIVSTQLSAYSTMESGNYLSGNIVYFGEAAEPGYTFTGWSGTGVGSVNSNSSTHYISVTVQGTNAITETANFVPTPTSYPINAIASPSGEGLVAESNSMSVLTNSQSLTNGTYTSQVSNNYAIGNTVYLGAAAEPGYAFTGWTGTGGSCSVTGTSSYISISVQCPAVETANFVPNPSNTVYLVSGKSNPSTEGLVAQGPTYASVNTLSAYHANVSESAVSGNTVWFGEAAEPGYTFIGWTGSGSGSFTGSNSFFSVVVNNIISETASFETTPTAGSPSMGYSSNVLDAGEQETFTTNVIPGSQPITYSWTINGQIVAGATSSSFTFSEAAAGTYTVAFNAIDSAGAQVTGSTTVTVQSALSISTQPSSNTIDTGQTDPLSSIVAGGTGHYSWQWYNAGSSISGASGTGSTATYTATGAGTYNVVFTDTGTGVTPAPTISSSTATVTVNGPLAIVSPTATSPVDAGQTISLSATASGGTGTYTTKQWYSQTTNTNSTTGATVLGSGLSTTTTQSSAGTVYYFFVLSDGGQTATSKTIAVTVDSALSVSTQPNSATIDSGQTDTLSAVVAGGTGTYSWQWYNAGSAVGSAGTGTTATYAATTSGTYNVIFTDTGSSGAPSATVSSSTATLTVDTAPSVSTQPASNTIESGQSATLTSTVAHGTGTFSWQWYNGGVAVSGATGTGTTASYSANAAGSYNVIFTDTGSTVTPYLTVGSSQATVTVNGAPSITSISPSTSVSIDVGQSETVSVLATGGTPPLTYAWTVASGDSCPGFSSSTSNSFTYTPTGTTSNCAFTVSVSDSVNGGPATANTAVINVAATLATPATPSPSSQSVDKGQTATIAGTAPTTGTAPYTYQWLEEAQGAGSYSNAVDCTTPTTLTCTFSTTAGTTAGSYSFELQVTDSANSVTVSSPVTLNIVSALGIPTIAPISPLIDNGQSIVLTATETGGSGPYSYQWYSGIPGGTNTLLTGQTSSTFSASPTLTGNYFVIATDTGSQGSPNYAVSAVGTVNVDAALGTPSVTPSSSTIDNGQTITLSSTTSGGTGTYSYQWYSGIPGGANVLLTGQTSNTIAVNPSSTTSYFIVTTDTGTSAGATPTVSKASSAATVNVDAALNTPTVTPSTPTIDQGQSIQLSTIETGGTGSSNYLYQWYSGTPGGTNSMIAGATSSTYNAAPSSVGTAFYFVSVTDNGITAGASPMQSAVSAAATVTVDAALGTPGVTPTSSIIDSGQLIVLTATESGGTSSTNYQYQWYTGTVGSGVPITGATSSTYTASPTITTSYYVSVIDGGVTSGSTPTATASSSAVTVTVDPAISTPTISPSSTTIDNGQTIVLGATVTGGTSISNYNYQWYTGAVGSGTPIAGATSSTYTAAPITTTSYYLQVTDSGVSAAATPAASANSIADTITVANALGTPTISPTAPSIDAGQQITLTASETGGTSSANYQYQWYTGVSGSGTPIAGANSITYTTAPSSTTSYYVKVTDSGANSQATPAASVLSASDPVTVSGAPTVTLTPNAAAFDAGQNVTYTTSISGGTGPFSTTLYNITGTPTSINVFAGTSNTFSFTVNYISSNSNSFATFTYNAVATDTGTTPSLAFNSIANTITVYPALSGNIVDPSIDIGQTAKLIAVPQGGRAPYAYQWYSGTVGSGTQISGQTSNTLSVPGTTAGNFLYYVVITDSLGVSFTPSGVTVNVVTAPTITLTPTTDHLNAGQSIAYTVSASNGIGPFNIELYNATANAATPLANVTIVSPGGSNTFTFTAENTGVFNYKAIATDSGSTANGIISPYTFNSALSTIDVGSTISATLSASNTTLDAGEYETLTADIVGGTGPFSVSFYNTANNQVVNTITSNTGGFLEGTFLPTAGSGPYNAVITDNGVTPTYQFSVNLPISESITTNTVPTASPLTPTSSILTYGQSETYTTTITGGTGPFTANLMLDGIVFATNTVPLSTGSALVTFNVIPPIGTDTYNVVVADKGTTTPYIFSTGSNTIIVNSASANVPVNATANLLPGIPTNIIYPDAGNSVLSIVEPANSVDTIANVLISNQTTNPAYDSTPAQGNVTFTEIGGTYNITINGAPPGTIYYFTMPFTCGTSPNPYKYHANNNTWTEIVSNRNTAGPICNLTFVIPQDPIIALFLSSPTLTIQPSLSFTAGTSGAQIIATSNPSTDPIELFVNGALVANALSGNVIYSLSGKSAGTYVANALDTAANTQISNTITINAAATVNSGGSGGGGGGGGGAGGGGGGGTQAPSITKVSNGYSVTGVAQLNTFMVNLGQAFDSTENFISPTDAGVTINGVSYTLTMNQPVEIASNSTAKTYLELTNLTYIPLQETINLLFYSVSNVTTTVATQANATTTSSAPTTNNTAPGSTLPSANSTTTTSSGANTTTTAPTNTTTNSTKVSAPSTGVSPAVAALGIGIAVAIAAAGAYYRFGRSGGRSSGGSRSLESEDGVEEGAS